MAELAPGEQTPTRRTWSPTVVAAVVGLLGAIGGGALSAALVSGRPAGPAPETALPAALAPEVARVEPTRPAAPTARTVAAPAAATPVDECRHCGTVERVTAVRQKGEGTGLGAVAGGVVGGVLGHQVGGGNGKKAMTVLGAVGGGVAGHEVERRARARTVYKVRLRMDDGTKRTVTLPEAPSVGQRLPA